jgi:hypothetical protein
MANKKYAHLVKPLSIAAMPGAERAFRNTGNADINLWLNGRDHLEGLELNFSWGFYTGLGDWHPGMDPHVHPYPEALVFVGLDPDNIEYLGAEMQYCLGKELEVHTFDKPSVIVAKGGVLHCPSVTKEVTNPIGYSFFIISLGAEPRTTWMGDGISEAQMKQMQGMTNSDRKPPMVSTFSKKKYPVNEETMTYGNKLGHLIKTMRPMASQTESMSAEEKAKYEKALGKGEVMRPGPGNTDSLMWMNGEDLEGIELNYTWGFYKKPGIWHRGPGSSDGAHVHPSDEVLVFAGTEPNDINYLGAEISIDLGEERERYVFDKPTVVVCPKGTAHAPIITRYVDRPFAFFMMNLASKYEITYV